VTNESKEIQTMHARSIMTSHVHACAADTSLAAAARMMWDHDIGFLPVLDDKWRLIGVVTDRDICMGALHQGGSLTERRVDAVMSHRLVSCEPETEVAEVERLFRKNQLRRLPVQDGHGHVVGVITLADIARSLEDELADIETTLEHRHPRRSSANRLDDVASVATLGEIADASRAIHQSCAGALATVETFAIITTPRHSDGAGQHPHVVHASARQPTLSLGELSRFGVIENDVAWIHE
jgi:CBS domain-containing protein